MVRLRRNVAAEWLAVGLVLASLAGTLGAIVTTYRRRPARMPKVEVAFIAPVPPRVDPPAPVPAPIPPPLPAPIDPTPSIVAKLAAAEAEQQAEADRLDREAAGLERARVAAEAEADRWRRRVALARAQLAALDEKAGTLEARADALALERDVLAADRETQKADLVKARGRSSYAVLPHRGENGTWRRPIVIECRDGRATLRPGGPSFGIFELAERNFIGRPHPLAALVAREAARISVGGSGAGSPEAVPYIFFLVRPDGVRPYYEARARLEPLGIAFGYELVEQDWEIDFPDDDSHAPVVGGSSRLATSPAPAADGLASFVWPSTPPTGLEEGDGEGGSESRGGGGSSRDRAARLGMTPAGRGMGGAGTPRGDGAGGGPAAGRPSATVGTPGVAEIEPRRTEGGRGDWAGEEPLEVVVSCGAKGLAIHPGGYRLSAQALRAKDGLLARQLAAVVESRRRASPGINLKPSIRFLVEAGGNETYWEARRQTMLVNLGWPATVQVAESDSPRLRPRGLFR